MNGRDENDQKKAADPSQKREDLPPDIALELSELQNKVKKLEGMMENIVSEMKKE
jgi:hypothetical protein